MEITFPPASKFYFVANINVGCFIVRRHSFVVKLVALILILYHIHFNRAHYGKSKQFLYLRRVMKR